MATPEEIAYYQSLSEEDKRRYTRQMAQEYQGRGASGEPISQSPKLRPAPAPSPQKLSLRGTMPRKPREPKPAPPAPSPPPKQSLGGRLLGGAKDFLSSDWMAQGSARVQGRAPPRRKGRQSETMAWLGRASENISRMDMNAFMPPIGLIGPEAHEHERRPQRKKGKKHRAQPIVEETRPWDINYVPPHLRRFF